MFTINKARKVAATLAASALMLGTLAVATPAVADDVSIGTAHGNISTTAAGKIIVHKRVLGGAGTGSPNSSDVSGLGAAIPGVTFKATKVAGVDLSTTAGWTFVDEVNHAALIADLTANRSHTSSGVTASVGTSIIQTTGNDGVATFNFSPALGLYLVEETAAPGAVVDRAEPFLVTLPFPYTTGTLPNLSSQWLYDVNVFPKNTLSTMNKSVQVQDIQGSNRTIVKFDLTAQVPEKVDKHFTYFGINDTLDGRLEASTATVTGFIGDTALAGDDFVVTKDGQTLTIKLTDLGLAKMDQAAATQATRPDIKFTIAANVTAVKLSGKTDGLIENQASYQIRTGSTTPPTGVPPVPTGDPGVTPKVDTKWGSFSATKVDAADITKPLAGAKFAIFPGVYQSSDATCAAPGAVSSYNVSNAIATAVSGGTGEFGFPLLYVGSTTEQRAFNCYVLVETEAPAGFDKLNEAISLKIAAGDNTTFYGAGSENNGKVLNPKSSVSGDISLPLTGAAGQLLMTLGGIALLAIAFGMVIVRRKQAAEAAN